MYQFLLAVQRLRGTTESYVLGVDWDKTRCQYLGRYYSVRCSCILQDAFNF